MPDLDRSEIVTLDELAEYLKVSPKTIHRILQAGEIPAIRVGNQWRFRKDAVMQALDERAMNPAAGDDLARVLGAENPTVPVTRLVDPDRIVLGIAPGSKREVLAPMVEALAAGQDRLDAEQYLALLLKREEMVSTAVGAAVAFPHIRDPRQAPVARPCVVVGVCPEGTDFDSLDGGPTYVLAMCCSPTEVVHLRLLAKMASLLRHGRTVEGIRRARTARDVLAVLAEADVREVPGR